MAVKVFIYLAEKDENLIIELAHKSEKITDFVRNLIEIFVVIKEKDREVFYDSENINQFFSNLKDVRHGVFLVFGQFSQKRIRSV